MLYRLKLIRIRQMRVRDQQVLLVIFRASNVLRTQKCRDI